MPSGTVKSTQDALDTIDRMRSSISGPLTEQINSFIATGDSLNEENFDGAHAAQFYGQWPETRTALQNALTELTDLATSIQNVNTNIQSAGGN
jgi:hypothetical protein